MKIKLSEGQAREIPWPGRGKEEAPLG